MEEGITNLWVSDILLSNAMLLMFFETSKTSYKQIAPKWMVAEI